VHLPDAADSSHITASLDDLGANQTISERYSADGPGSASPPRR